MHITLPYLHLANPTPHILSKRHTQDITLKMLDIWFTLNGPDFHLNSSTTWLESSIFTPYYRLNTLPSFIHTMHHSMALSFHTSSIIPSHFTQTLPFSQLHTSLHPSSQRGELYSQHTRYTIYCMALWIFSMFFPTGLDASLNTHTHTMFHCHLSMNTPSLITECLFQDRQHWPTPGYHSIIKDTQDYLP